MPVSIRVCFLGLCLLIAQVAAAQTAATVDDWNRHYLDGTLRLKPATPKAKTPLPATVNVPITTSLILDTLGAAVMDVYLGACSSPPRVAIAVPVGTYTPAAPLLQNTKYCWKVVLINPAGTITSPTWSFTTAGTPPPVNQPPVVTVPAMQPVTLPAGVTLNGSATDDGLPSPPATLTYAWSQVSGPPNGVTTFSTPTAPSTGANFSIAGTYVLRLTVSDSVLAGLADTTVGVNPPGAPPALMLSYIGKTRDVVGPSEAAGVDGQLDGEFLLALSVSATVTQVRLDSQGSAGNGTWDTVPGNATWRAGIALTPTGTLINSADGSIQPTPAQALSAFVADSGYLASGATIVATVTLSTGMVLTSSVTLTGGGPPPCDPNPDPTLNCVKNPTAAEYDPSKDDALVTEYTFEATCGSTVLSESLGKPQIGSNGKMTKTVALLATIPVTVLCSATVTAITPSGSQISVPSNPFMRQ